MRTTIDIDDALMAEAMEATGATTKKAVEAALRTVVKRHRQARAWQALKGMGWDGDLDRLRTAQAL